MRKIYMGIIAAGAAIIVNGGLMAAVAQNVTGASDGAPEHNVVGIHPAHSPQGRMLTMEEAVLGKNIMPKISTYRWENGVPVEGWKQDEAISCIYKGINGIEDIAASPDGKIYSFITDKGLYLTDTLLNVKAVAESSVDGIKYGTFVSRNEFGIEGGMFWSPDGSKLAFYRKDERKVTKFPLLDINTRTGSLKEIRYPMAGMDSEILRLCIYDMESRDTVHLKVNDFGYDRYLTCVTWSPDCRNVFVQVLDRSQRHLKLNMYDAADGSFVRTVLTEDNDKYVEPYERLHFISDDKFIYSSANRDGYHSLYLCDVNGKVDRLTKVSADVSYVADDGKYVYYYSSEVSPAEQHLFRVSLKNGKTARLTPEEGWHNVRMRGDCKEFIDTYTSLNVPGEVNHRSNDGKLIRNLCKVESPVEDYAYGEIEFGTIKSADGKFDNAYRLIKPKDFNPEKKYPVIVYVYGGPHLQIVKNSWLAYMRSWEMLMAQKGYVVYVQDNRGTPCHGMEYEQAIWGQCGQAEMADQMEGVKMLKSLPYVDADRIGVHGWSYGGFMTISLITNYPETFKVAVAGGPVIDWKWYEVMYGERYMGSPQENPEGYDKVSLINKATSLKGKLLICQGAVDPVVVWEHSLSFIRECIKNHIQVDYFPYPCAEHNVLGKDRIHLMDKVTMYFDDYL